MNLDNQVTQLQNKVKELEDQNRIYVAWLDKRDKESSIAFWKSQLEGYEGDALIDSDEDVGKCVQITEISLDKEKTKALQMLAVNERITLSDILETVWGIVLQWYNNTEDVVFGKVMAGRNADITGIEETIGLFINTVPCRVTSTEEMSVKELLKIVSRNGIEETSHCFLSLAEIQSAVIQRGKLIKTLFVFENYYADEKCKQNLLTLESSREETNYDLNMSAYVSSAHLYIRLMYNSAKYSENEITALFDCIINIIEQIIKRPDIKIKELEMASPKVQVKILGEFNNTEMPYPKEKTMIELLEEQVRRTPDKTALIYEEEKMSYQELNAKANQLANKLRACGAKPGEMVCVISERGIGRIIGLLGIIKSGSAYVPIDPEYPKERIRYMLEDCRQ